MLVRLLEGKIQSHDILALVHGILMQTTMLKIMVLFHYKTAACEFAEAEWNFM